LRKAAACVTCEYWSTIEDIANHIVLSRRGVSWWNVMIIVEKGLSLAGGKQGKCAKLSATILGCDQNWNCLAWFGFWSELPEKISSAMA
jgi:hypothetical protein